MSPLIDLSLLCSATLRRPQGCAGGNPLLAFYFLHQYGVTDAASYPYTARMGTCQVEKANQPVASVESWGILTPDHEDNMEKVLRFVGPGERLDAAVPCRTNVCALPTADPASSSFLSCGRDDRRRPGIFDVCRGNIYEYQGGEVRFGPGGSRIVDHGLRGGGRRRWKCAEILDW